MVHWATIISCLLTESAECANNPPRNPPTQTQQISSPRAVFATLPHSSCCILSHSTRNGALNSIYWIWYMQKDHHKSMLMTLFNGHKHASTHTQHTHNKHTHMLRAYTQTSIHIYIIVNSSPEMYSKFVLTNHFWSAKPWNWSENGQWPTAKYFRFCVCISCMHAHTTHSYT